MAKQVLIACVVALTVMLACSVLGQMFVPQFNRETLTPLGPLPLGDALSVLLAMTAGGAIARTPRFRWIAVLLQAVVWLVIVLALSTRPGSAAVASMSLGAILRYNAVAFGASLLAAFLGAWLGEWLAARRASTRLPARG